MHTLPPLHTLSPRLIYTDMIDPRHATFTLNNVDGRDGCFWFPTRGQHLNGRRLNTPWFCLFKDPQPCLPCRPLVSVQMKWTNAKSMFLVLLITIFIPLSSLFPGRLRVYWCPWLSPLRLRFSHLLLMCFGCLSTLTLTRRHIWRMNPWWCSYCRNLSIFHLFFINAAGFSQTVFMCSHHREGDEIQILSVDLMSFRKWLHCKLTWGY